MHLGWIARLSSDIETIVQMHKVDLEVEQRCGGGGGGSNGWGKMRAR